METDSVALLFLDYLVELPSTIASLISTEAATIFNKPFHGLSRDGVIDELRVLCESGLIEITWHGQKMTMDQLNNQEDPTDCLVQLTGKGGIIWESAFKPDWSEYVAISVNYNKQDTELVRFEALNIDRLVSIETEISDIVVRSDLIAVKPWNATYWKRFDLGYALTAEIQNNLLPDAFYLRIRPQWYARKK